MATKSRCQPKEQCRCSCSIVCQSSSINFGTSSCLCEARQGDCGLVGVGCVDGTDGFNVRHVDTRHVRGVDILGCQPCKPGLSELLDALHERSRRRGGPVYDRMTTEAVVYGLYASDPAFCHSLVWCGYGGKECHSTRWCPHCSRKSARKAVRKLQEMWVDQDVELVQVVLSSRDVYDVDGLSVEAIHNVWSDMVKAIAKILVGGIVIRELAQTVGSLQVRPHVTGFGVLRPGCSLESPRSSWSIHIQTCDHDLYQAVEYALKVNQIRLEDKCTKVTLLEQQKALEPLVWAEHMEGLREIHHGKHRWSAFGFKKPIPSKSQNGIKVVVTQPWDPVTVDTCVLSSALDSSLESTGAFWVEQESQCAHSNGSWAWDLGP